jgi:hypothetical protein
MMSVKDLIFAVRATEKESAEIRSLLKQVKRKSGKKAGEAITVSLRLYNNILDGHIGGLKDGKD